MVVIAVQKSTMASKDQTKSLTSGDHLMRLGQYLAWVERHAGWTLEDMEYLEDKFQKEPWMNWPQVVFTTGHQNAAIPFILLANGNTNAQRPHISKISMAGQEEQVNHFFGPDMDVDMFCCPVCPSRKRLSILLRAN